MAVAGGCPDRTPVIIPGGMMAGTLYDLMAHYRLGYPDIHTNPAAMARYARLLQETCNLDNYGVPLCMTVEAEDFGAGIDLGNPLKEPRVSFFPAGAVETIPDLTPHPSGRHKAVLDAIGLLSGKDIPVVGNIIGPVSLLTSLTDPMTVFRAMEKRPDEVSQALDHVARHILTFGKEQMSAGADFLVIADPSASGEILGPDYFNRYASPCLNQTITSLKTKRKPVILHICGNIQTILPQLAKMPWDVLSVDSMVALKKLRDYFPDRVLMGNLSTHLLVSSDETRVTASAARCLEYTAVLSPACGIPTITPVANIRAMTAASNPSKKTGIIQ